MSEIVQWMQDRATDTYGKFRSPLYLTFLFAALAWHWEIVLYVFLTSDRVEEMIKNLTDGVLPIRWWQPFVTTAVLHFLYPMFQVASDRWSSTIAIAVAIVVDNWDIKLRAIKKAREDAATLAANLDAEVVRLQDQVNTSKEEQERLREVQQNLNTQNAALVGEINEMQAQNEEMTERKSKLSQQKETSRNLHEYLIHFESGNPKSNLNDTIEVLETEKSTREPLWDDFEVTAEVDKHLIGDPGRVRVRIWSDEKASRVSNYLHDMEMFSGLRIDHVT